MRNLNVTIILIMGLIITGCVPMTKTHGIPNFAQVSPGIYRGGQPDAEGWAYLKSIGVVTVIKLNPASEGADDYVRFDVYETPLNFSQQMGFERIPERWGTGFDGGIGSTFIHCSHGQDRTGLFVAMRRVRVDGWTPGAAEKEMLERGFHKELTGLWEYWERFKAENEKP